MLNQFYLSLCETATIWLTSFANHYQYVLLLLLHSGTILITSSSYYNLNRFFYRYHDDILFANPILFTRFCSEPSYTIWLPQKFLCCNYMFEPLQLTKSNQSLIKIYATNRWNNFFRWFYWIFWHFTWIVDFSHFI
jgi:hypothetical protein